MVVVAGIILKQKIHSVNIKSELPNFCDEKYHSFRQMPERIETGKMTCF